MDTEFSENYAEDFLQQILEFPPYTGALSLTENDGDTVVSQMSCATGDGVFHGTMFQMQSDSVKGSMRSMFSAFDHLRSHSVQPIVSPLRQGERDGGGNNPEAWDKWSNDGSKEEVAKLTKDVGAALLFLQSKAHCKMPAWLAAAIYPMCIPDGPIPAKPKLNAHDRP